MTTADAPADGFRPRCLARADNLMGTAFLGR